ncbi:MAG: SDR family oxidoreductase [Candidatus Dormibacteraeota bacterium]|nr:SDR family oxidoreductase [Candidatus Dormibacteraeota bacterium]
MGGELDGKVAIVTGAGSGIGHAIAERFGREGAAVGVNYFGYESQAEELASRISRAGRKSIAVMADVSDRDQVQDMVEQVLKQLGRVDVLVNNAGVESPAPFLEITEQSWDKMLNVDLKGAFLCAQACGRAMKEIGGSIINISSIHEDHTFPGFTPYCAAKGGLRMMMRNAALELSQYRIRVNNIAPGAIATPINEPTLHDPKKMAELHRIIPLGEMGRPEDVAEVALFLASDRSRYVTGSTYFVDGGMVRYAEAI